MIRFTQKEIDLIGDKLFGSIKHNSDYTVFEFEKLLKANNLTVLTGQIYRYNDAENYFNIDFHFKLLSDTYVYITASKDGYTFDLILNLIENKVEDYE